MAPLTRRIATPTAAIKLSLYNDKDEVVDAETADLSNIASIVFTPGGQSMASMPQGFIQDRLSGGPLNHVEASKSAHISVAFGRQLQQASPTA